MNKEKIEFWFLTGSQELYGEETLKQVAKDSEAMVRELNDSPIITAKLVYKPVLKNPAAITKIMQEANADAKCAGLVTWMHTFSPSKMWIGGLSQLQKPILHLHTQYNRDIPWDKIDMDFMNLNQSAHGGREYGFMLSRMRIERKVVVGYFKDEQVQQKVAVWMQAAAGWSELRNLKVARFGDNMREVAVTEGDKVEAQWRLGFSVAGYGTGDLVKYVNSVDDRSIKGLLDQYAEQYNTGSIFKNEKDLAKLKDAARIEAGMRAFLTEGGFGAFTTTFEDLNGLPQLPGLAVQRLMADGYGFGAEGDWKTAAMVRAMKVMADGIEGGTSFMEDYTYHLQPGNMKVLGAHMLEVCPSIASAKPSLELHPLSIGGKDDPARLVFNAPSGPALNASLMDMGNRFRLLVNTVKVVQADADLPKLPVARAVWVPEPDLPTGAAGWILAGGAHHTVFSQALTAEHLEDFAEMAGIEFLLIDENSTIREFKKELRWNDIYYMMKNSLR